VAHPHFGNLGDVWKHLALAEVLAIERSRAYWETHCGAALHPMAPSPERDRGIGHFLAHLEEADSLRESVFAQALEAVRIDGYLELYPGSPALAHAVLGDVEGGYLFCDLDPACIESIRDCSRELSWSSASVRALCADGLETIAEELGMRSARELEETFLLIDPHRALEAGEGGLDSVDLFCLAVERGVRAILWYGFDELPARTELRRVFQARIHGSPMLRGRSSLTVAEVQLLAPPGTPLPPECGLRGCGILCGNLRGSSLAAISDLGQSLVSIYTDTWLDRGQWGALRLEVQRF